MDMEAKSFYENFYSNIRCAVCQEVLSGPKVLQCQHRFCGKCFYELLGQAFRHPCFLCPICGQESCVTKIVDDFRELDLVRWHEKKEARMLAKRMLKSCQVCKKNTCEYFRKKYDEVDEYVCKTCLTFYAMSNCEEINPKVEGSPQEVAVINQLNIMLEELQLEGHRFALQRVYVKEVTCKAKESCFIELDDLRERDIRRVKEFYQKQKDILQEWRDEKFEHVEDRRRKMVRKVEILQQKIIEAKHNKEKLLGEDAFSLELMNRELLLIRDDEWSPLRFKIQNRAAGALDQNKALTVEKDDPSPIVDIEAVAESLGDEELKIPITAAQKCLETEGYAL